MNLIFGMKVIYLMRLDSLVKIVAERCTRNTTKVPTVWNINYQIIKNNNTTTQKKGIGVFFPDAFLMQKSACRGSVCRVKWKSYACIFEHAHCSFTKFSELE